MEHSQERRSATGRRHYGESQRLGDATPRQRHTDAARGHARMPYRLGPSHAGLLFEFASSAEARGCKVIIAGAGGAAHLAWQQPKPLPVLGVPVQSRALQGVDSLLSIVQMPRGVPVGTLAIGEAGAVNAALLLRRSWPWKTLSCGSDSKKSANARRHRYWRSACEYTIARQYHCRPRWGTARPYAGLRGPAHGLQRGSPRSDGKGPAAQVADCSSRQPLMTRVRHWSWRPGPMSSPWRRNSFRTTSWSSSANPCVLPPWSCAPSRTKRPKDFLGPRFPRATVCHDH